jgi:phosphatidylglycerophosphatase A
MIESGEKRLNNESEPCRDRLRVFLGTACWLGLAPVAPGSFGALLGVIIHVVICVCLPTGAKIPALIIALAAVSAVHYILTPWAVRYWKDEDPKNFVLDEVAGYLVVPILFQHGHLWQVALWGFLAFRILDVIKVPPALQIDRDMHGPWGILLDDIVSGIYAVLTLYVMWWLSNRFGLGSWLIANN